MDEQACLEIVQNRLKKHGLASFYGIKARTVSCGRAVLEMKVANHHLNVKMAVHGGCLATLVSVAALAAGWTSGADAENCCVSVDYIRNSTVNDTLTARALVEHSGRATAVIRVELNDSMGRRLCVGVCSMAVQDDDPEIPREW